ncbi:MAG: 23S rRNA (pseudouridine(1915)-N(3))-methyltransferase RlmH [Bacteroidota bacterium]
MKIVLLQVGKTDDKYLNDGLSVYHSRIQKLMPFEVKTVAESKARQKKPVSVVKKEEAERILAACRKGDTLILLDEGGKSMGSRNFATFLQKTMNTGPRRIVFIIGGPGGVHHELKDRADKVLSLSAMTFSHQLVRLLFAEQLYRALTILKGIPYHND